MDLLPECRLNISVILIDICVLDKAELAFFFLSCGPLLSVFAGLNFGSD